MFKAPETSEDFKKEIFAAVAAIATIEIDKKKTGNSMRFTCSDEVGEIEIIARRTVNEH